MRVALVPPVRRGEPLPLLPPLLATRGPGARSDGHAHHAMHLVVALEGTLGVRVGPGGGVRRAAGVLTTPDVEHAIDAQGVEVLLVFLDPESDAGQALRGALTEPVRLLSAAERDAVLAEPTTLMQHQEAALAWTRALSELLGGARLPVRQVHPRVRRLVRRLRAAGPEEDVSLEALAKIAGLSPGRLMHVFTDSIGLPLRPYLGWLKLQRATAAIAAGLPFAEAAAAAGFSDAAHMSRSFRRMFGMTPSAIRAAR